MVLLAFLTTGLGCAEPPAENVPPELTASTDAAGATVTLGTGPLRSRSP